MRNISSIPSICWRMSLFQTLECWRRRFWCFHQTWRTLIGLSRSCSMHRTFNTISMQRLNPDGSNHVSFGTVALLLMDHDIRPLQKGFLGFWIFVTVMSFTKEPSSIRQTQWNGLHHLAVLPRNSCLEQETFLLYAFATETIFHIRKTASIVGLVLVLALQLFFGIFLRTRTWRHFSLGHPGATNKAWYFWKMRRNMNIICYSLIISSSLSQRKLIWYGETIWTACGRNGLCCLTAWLTCNT